ncbi:Agamous-like MADS-box protein AGL30 [Linum perenne]
MGRVKLKIKKLENTNGRQATYGKRKHGIMKKANELSILCDIPIILLMFSPTGKPALCKGKRRYASVTSCLCLNLYLMDFHGEKLACSSDGSVYLVFYWVEMVYYSNF